MARERQASLSPAGQVMFTPGWSNWVISSGYEQKEKFQVYERYCQNKPRSEQLWRQCSDSAFFQVPANLLHRVKYEQSYGSGLGRFRLIVTVIPDIEIFESKTITTLICCVGFPGSRFVFLIFSLWTLSSSFFVSFCFWRSARRSWITSWASTPTSWNQSSASPSTSFCSRFL